MKKSTLLFIPAFSLMLFGAGCQSTQQVVINPPPVTPPVVTSSSTTILVSNEDAAKYCNGADMDSAGYRKTITVEKTIDLPANQTQSEHAKSIIIAATTGMCQEVLRQLDITETSGTVHIPMIEGWAGVSIAMCSCTPQVEVNALRIPGVQNIVWDTN